MEAMLRVRWGRERNFKGEETDRVVEMRRSRHAEEVDTFRLGKLTLVLDHLFVAAGEEGEAKSRFVYAVSMNAILRSSNLALLRVGGEAARYQFHTSPESGYCKGMETIFTSCQMERSHHRADSSANHSHSVYGTWSDLLLTIRC